MPGLFGIQSLPSLMKEKVITDNKAENFSLLILDNSHQFTNDLLHLPGNKFHFPLGTSGWEKEVKRFPRIDSLYHLPQFRCEILQLVGWKVEGELLSQELLDSFFSSRKFDNFTHIIILRLSKRPAQGGLERTAGRETRL